MNALLGALGGFLMLAQTAVMDRPYVDFDIVVRELAAQGEWVADGADRFAFRPREVPAGWAPYREGQWVYTDYGWTWAGRDPGAWVTGHYGHWKRSSAGGWVWVPGKDWLAGGVEWLQSGDHIGWRPVRLDRFSNPVGKTGGGLAKAEDWNFIPAEKIRGRLKAADYADAATVAGLLARAHPLDHIYVAHWEIPRPGPSPEILKDESGKVPPARTIRDLAAPGPVEPGAEGFPAYRPRFHQDADGIFRRVELFLNPRKENPEYQSVKETLSPDRKPDPAEEKKQEKAREMELRRKQHQEDLYR